MAWLHYDDYRNHLMSWEEYEQEVHGYGELVGLPVEAEAFVAQLREQLRTQAKEVDKRFPENGHVDIDDTGIVIRRAERQNRGLGSNGTVNTLKPVLDVNPRSCAPSCTRATPH